MSDEEAPVEQAAIAGIGTKVFGKWDATEVVCSDPGIAPYVNLTTIGTPHSGGRHARESTAEKENTEKNDRNINKKGEIYYKRKILSMA